MKSWVLTLTVLAVLCASSCQAEKGPTTYRSLLQTDTADAVDSDAATYSSDIRPGRWPYCRCLNYSSSGLPYRMLFQPLKDGYFCFTIQNLRFPPATNDTACYRKLQEKTFRIIFSVSNTCKKDFTDAGSWVEYNNVKRAGGVYWEDWNANPINPTIPMESSLKVTGLNINAATVAVTPLTSVCIKSTMKTCNATQFFPQWFAGLGPGGQILGRSPLFVMTDEAHECCPGTGDGPRADNPPPPNPPPPPP
eukprot:CAMPEP_0202899858 /NCGR_PEP_ID=MMETSP1392-20130828/8995_1 /ASSEMBLY_ACC=CAM_ASM_000868 /TAXON_ID=225041 /ORGANISM="Chlamydomonas chlamydogama, Strain SAG 11-48b" /LENGTH=249 /DNA_ID=CAMNT_0049586147 /DNA_START=269 /DNA_END=1014 /DNA_ORIENTATION=+